MKKLLSVMGLLFALTVLVMPPAYAADSGKTGIIDMTMVINNSEAGKKANAELNAFVQAKRAEVQEKAKNVDGMKKALDEQASALSPEDKKAKQDELNKAFADYQTTLSQSNAEAQKKQAELRSQVLQEIKEVLTKVAQEDKYTFILDVSTVPYFDKSTDITDKVIQKYNEMKK